MRILGSLLFVLTTPIVWAQGSLEELKDATDVGQERIDRIPHRTGPDPHAVFDAAQVDRPPGYPGGDEALRLDLGIGCDGHYDRLSANCSGPIELTLRFVVGSDGRAAHTEVVGAQVCAGVDELVWCRMRTLKRFEPGLKDGRLVRTRISMPVVLRFP
jgi:hypothetical protein